MDLSNKITFGFAFLLAAMLGVVLINAKAVEKLIDKSTAKAYGWLLLVMSLMILVGMVLKWHLPDATFWKR